MSIKHGKDEVVFGVAAYVSVALFTVVCVVPFILVVSGSFSSESQIYLKGYSLLPRGFSLDAYRLAFVKPDSLVHAYLVTILLTLTGTVVGLFFCAMTAYALHRRDFRSRKFFALFFYFTTLFSGGLVPTYILYIRYLHLKNNYLSLLFPLLFTVFDIIIMRTFMQSIPESLGESARIDGAGEFRTFISIYLPLVQPALATLGLFTALRYWNDWYNAMLYLSDKNMWPLQFYLYNLLANAKMAVDAAGGAGIVFSTPPTETFKLAMTVIATGPIVLLYPFLQRYFIAGLTVGSVKG